MAPVCTLSRAPRSFAIPLVDSTPHGDVSAYVAPLQELEALARHLVGASYGGTQQLVGAAIVEESTEEASRIWWLVLTRNSETKAANFKQWLCKRLPPETRLDVEQLQTLTPLMQRRLGWGDVRTTPELLEALRLESALPAGPAARGDDLLDARLKLAAEELDLRAPSTARDVDHPVMATRLGRKAAKLRKIGDCELLQKLSEVANALALPPPAPVRQEALTLPSAPSDWVWLPVARALCVEDLLPLRATCTPVRRAVYYRAPDLQLAGKHEKCYLHSKMRVMRFGLFEYAAEQKSETTADEPNATEPRCQTICVWGSEPFQVFASAKEENATELYFLVRELGGDVTFPRLLVKVLYAIHGVVPPRPMLGSKLLVQMKTLWALHTSARPVDALNALDLDLVDVALGRPAVTRCRVCYKPCSGLKGSQPVHRECQEISFICQVEGCGWMGELPPAPSCNDEKAALAEGLNKILAMLPRRCPQCGFRGKTRRTDRPETRPMSTKISRKK